MVQDSRRILRHRWVVVFPLLWHDYLFDLAFYENFHSVLELLPNLQMIYIEIIFCREYLYIMFLVHMERLMISNIPNINTDLPFSYIHHHYFIVLKQKLNDFVWEYDTISRSVGSQVECFIHFTLSLHTYIVCINTFGFHHRNNIRCCTKNLTKNRFLILINQILPNLCIQISW